MTKIKIFFIFFFGVSILGSSLKLWPILVSFPLSTHTMRLCLYQLAAGLYICITHTRRTQSIRGLWQIAVILSRATGTQRSECRHTRYGPNSVRAYELMHSDFKFNQVWSVACGLKSRLFAPNLSFGNKK